MWPRSGFGWMFFLCVDVCSSYVVLFADNLNMFGVFKADRLKVNLRLAINRLKLLEKKKSKVYSENWLLFSVNSLLDCTSSILILCVIYIFYSLAHVAELAQKARKEIADYLSSGKDERARIRVEHIIREDYLVEAMEILELYCDLLLTRFGLIQTMKLVICSTWFKHFAVFNYIYPWWWYFDCLFLLGN